MTIDWVTIAAQIANFLVLVWLLKRFLFGPVVAAMDRREARIAQRLHEAAESRAKAEREAIITAELLDVVAGAEVLGAGEAL